MVPFGSRHNRIKFIQKSVQNQCVNNLNSILKMPLKSNGVELLNLLRILNHLSAICSILKEVPIFEASYVIHKLGKSILSKIFNFSKFVVSSLDLNAYVKDNSTLSCHCVDSCFIDKDHGKILTGDLRIINKNKLMKLFTKEPKYRVTR